MTTIPSRKSTLIDNLMSILNQTFRFDKFCINIDDYMSFEDYEFYFGLEKLDSRIEVNICDRKWRSCNKLLPTLKKYPEAVIITVDDDILYPKDCIETLIKGYKNNPDCVISHDSSPIIIEDGKFIQITNNVDIRLNQKKFGRYFSMCCLFPPHIFDGTDLYDYDKMKYCTEGTHDELWFWLMSTMNCVKSVALNDIHDFGTYILKDAYSDGYKLSDINCDVSTMLKYNDNIKNLYGDKLDEIVGKSKTEFVLTKDNIYNFFYNFWIVRIFYKNNFVLNLDNLPDSYFKELSDFLNGSEINLDDVKI